MKLCMTLIVESVHRCTYTVRCTVYAQISGLAQKTNVISESPQWENNSKGLFVGLAVGRLMFQSPQWGDNSKGGLYK